jgi:hypothetical protein
MTKTHTGHVHLPLSFESRLRLEDVMYFTLLSRETLAISFKCVPNFHGGIVDERLLRPYLVCHLSGLAPPGIHTLDELNHSYCYTIDLTLV